MTLTAEEIWSLLDQVRFSSAPNDPTRALRAIAEQASRCPALEAEVARLDAIASDHWETTVRQAKRIFESEAERDRYRKVAEEAHAFLSEILAPLSGGYYVDTSRSLIAALAAVGMKVEE